jgi:hypothetical protein
MSEIASSHWQRAKVASGNTIGFIECTRAGETIGFEIGTLCRQHALTLGYQLEIFRREEFSSSAKLQRVLRNRGITDVILGPVYEKTLTVELDWDKFICIQLQPGLFSLPFHSVVKDHFNTVVLAWQKAVSYGYRRIGITLLRHQVQLADDVLRLSAVYACQKVYFPHLPVLPPFYFPAGSVDEKPFVRWVKDNDLDAVIGFSPGHYYFTRSRFAPEMPFACFHLQDAEEISGILVPAENIAIEGINLLHFCRRTYQWGIPRQRIDHLLEPIWVEGTSLPKRKS